MTRHDYFATYDVTAYRAVTKTPAFNASAQAVQEEGGAVARPLPEATQHVSRPSMASDTLSALIASQAQAGAAPSPSAAPSEEASGDYDGFTKWSDVWGGIRTELLSRVGGG